MFGIKNRQRALYMCCQVFCIAMALWLLSQGSGLILSSEDTEDNILNPLAITFVSEFDDVVYRFCTPTFAQGVLKDMPPVQWSVQSQLTLWVSLLQRLSGYFDPAIGPALTAMIVHIWFADDTTAVSFAFGVPIGLTLCGAFFCGCFHLSDTQEDIDFDPWGNFRSADPGPETSVGRHANDE